MFGVFRLLLALLVAFGHLTSRFGYLGFFAVFGFYTLSGYLVTLVLRDRYHFRAKPFFINRALRIYPDYWAVALLSLAIILTVHGAAEFHAGYAVKGGIMHVLGNALLVPYQFYGAPFRLVPPSWSIAVELSHYFFLWFVVARRRAFAIGALIIWLGCHLWSFHQGQPWYDRYFPVTAAGLPFACGALIYFFRPAIMSLSQRASNGLGYWAFALFSAVCTACGFDGGPDGRHFNFLFYLSFASLLIVTISLSRLTPSTQLIARIDNFAGTLSYPVFLSHWIIGFLVGHYLLHSSATGLLLFSVSIPSILIFSVVLARINGAILDPLRSGIRRTVTEPGHSSILPPQ